MAFHFLHSIFTGPNQPGKFAKELMLRGIERVVDGTDPRLRAVSHYRRKLWDSVEPVSYTHLDVYKRQVRNHRAG